MQPFFRVYIGKDDFEITEKVESFHYENCSEEDDLLTLKISTTLQELMSENHPFKQGRYVSFVHGILGGARSRVHSARVTKIEPVFGDRVSLTLKCLDLGTTMKRNGPKKVWKGVTTEQIIKTIAEAYNYDYKIDLPTRMWDSLPQAGKSDFEFLQDLSKKEKGGNYIFYVIGSTLYYVNRATHKNSELTFTYGADDRVISFEPVWDESSESGATDKVETKNFDFEKMFENVTVDNAKEAATGTLGDIKRNYNANGDFVGAVKDAGKNVVETFADKPEAEAVSNSLKKSSALKVLTATLNLYGVPNLEANMVITMENVPREYAGNWLISKVEFSGDGKVTASMKKNGSKSDKTGTDKAGDANTKKGPEDKNETVAVRTYDVNGNELKSSIEARKKNLVNGKPK